MEARQAVDAPRMHHQWFPDDVHFEGVSEHETAVSALRAMGHSVIGTSQGDAHTIGTHPRSGRLIGAEDRRINGKVASF